MSSNVRLYLRLYLNSSVPSILLWFSLPLWSQLIHSLSHTDLNTPPSPDCYHSLFLNCVEISICKHSTLTLPSVTLSSSLLCNTLFERLPILNWLYHLPLVAQTIYLFFVYNNSKEWVQILYCTLENKHISKSKFIQLCLFFVITLCTTPEMRALIIVIVTTSSRYQT